MTALAKIRRNLIIFLAVILMACLPLPALASIQGDSVLESKPVAEGLLMEKHVLSVGGGKTLVYILRADVTNPYLKINTLIGADGNFAKNGKVTDMAVTSGAVAAVNGDFFQMSESGRPVGMAYRDGLMVASPPLRGDMYGWGITRDGKPLIDLFSFTGTVTAANGKSFSLAGVNKPLYYVGGDDSNPITSHDNALLLYNRQWGDTSRGKTGEADNVTEMFVSNGTVTAITVNQAGQMIPQDGLVLAGRGLAAEFIKQNIKVGDKLSVDYSVAPGGDELWAGTGGWSILVEDGRAKDQFPSSINGPVSRTSIAYSPGGNSLLVVVAEKSSVSRGLTLNELAEYLVSLKVEKALNLDGGGSTTLAARPLGEESAVLVNTPEKNTQRLVPTAVGFFSDAPRGELSGLIIKGPEIILAGDEGSFALKGYDTHFNPVAVDQGKVNWSVSEGPGAFSGGSFKADTGGLATIAAGYDGKTMTRPVKILGSEDLRSLVAEPSSIALRPGQTVNLSVKAVGKDGTVYNLTDKHFSVDVDKALGTYQNGVFKASETAATGEMAITFDKMAVTVPVTVRGDDQAALSFVPGQPGELRLGNLVLSLPGSAFAVPLSLSASLGGELSTPIPERYKADTLVDIKVDEEDITSMADFASLKWTYRTGEPGRMAVLQLKGNAWVEIPSTVDQEENTVTCQIKELGVVALVRELKAPVSFVDMEGHWAEKIVADLAAQGIVSGYPGNIFDPGRQVTRAEFSVMLCKVFGWEPATGSAGFRDEATIADWARGYVVAAYKKGVISGYEDRTFLPTRQVTRAEMAAMVSKALSLQPDNSIKLDKLFRDGGSIDKWAVEPVSAVYSSGLMKGDDENRFRAKDRATRAESAALMDNVLKYMLRGQILTQ
jgi:exopolysaccharide biosynthesis protein